jgi:hypothetical protein
MFYLLTLGVGQTLLDALHVGFVNVHLAAQLTLTLARFLRQDMTTVGLTAFEAIRCFAKTLRRSPLSFQLGHDRLLIFSPVRRHPSSALERMPLQAGRRTFYG